MPGAAVFAVLGILSPATSDLGARDSQDMQAWDARPIDEEYFAEVSSNQKENFSRIIENIMNTFRPVAAGHGAKIEYEIAWNSSGMGAFTFRKDAGKTWYFNFYDGVLRLPFVTDDLIASIVCHEIGHHLAGYPFAENRWSSAEGQADYFSTHACLPRVWEHDIEKNKTFSSQISPDERKKCDVLFDSEPRRNICHRGMAAMKTIVQYEGYKLAKPPKLSTPDQTVVKETNLKHPGAQCRVDTQLAGFFCNKVFDFVRVPGSVSLGENTPEAETDSNRSVCVNHDAARPKCWFAPLGDQNE